jgi:hypothetical protein
MPEQGYQEITHDHANNKDIQLTQQNGFCSAGIGRRVFWCERVSRKTDQEKNEINNGPG